jgi:cytochrome c
MAWPNHDFFTPLHPVFVVAILEGMTKGNFQQQKTTEKRKLARGQSRPGHSNLSKDQLYAMLTDAWKNTQELSKRRKVGAVK